MLNEAQAQAKAEARDFFRNNLPTKAFAAEGAVGRYAGNVIGFGIGPKIIEESTVVGQDAVRIYVRVKIPKTQVSRKQKLPPSFGDLPTDVIEVGNVTSFAAVETWQRFERHRPASCGVSIGHPKVSAGTLGCLVEKNSYHYILSNNHILAYGNTAAPGDPILQPGPMDGGAAAKDGIATLAEFKPLDFAGNPNTFDAAIAQVGLNTQTDIEPDIIEIGRPKTTPRTPAMYQSVRKHGRTTGHTIGVITDLSADLWVDYRIGGVNHSAWFENQLAVLGVGCAPFSRSGDSGALIVDAVTLEPMALLFAGGTSGNSLTFANPIGPVLDYFKVGIVGQ